MPKAKFESAEEIEDGIFEVEDKELPQVDMRNSYERKLDDLYSAVTNKQELSISIYQQSPGGQNSGLQLCESVPADKYSYDNLLMYIKSTYGPGDYRLRIQQNGRLAMNELVSIARPLQNNHRKPGESVEMMDRLLDRMDRQDERMREMMDNKNGGEGDRMQFMREMVMMKEIFGGNQQPAGNGVQDMFVMLSGLKDLGVEIGGVTGGGGDESFLSFLGGTMPILEKIAGGAVDNQLNETKAKAEMFDNLKAKAKQAKETINPQAAQIMGALNMLIGAAVKNKPVDLYAELVIDQVPPKVLKMIYESDNIIELLSSIAPKLQPKLDKLKPWFDALHADIKEIVNENLTETDESVIEGEPETDAGTPNSDDNIPINGNSERGSGHESDAQIDAGSSTPV